MTTDSTLDIRDQSLINLTSNTRERIIHDLVKEGIPTDKEDREFLIKAMDGLDRTILSKAKIKVEKELQNTQQDAVNLVANILSRFDVKNTNQVERLVNIDESLQPSRVINGEDIIGTVTIDLDEII